MITFGLVVVKVDVVVEVDVVALVLVEVVDVLVVEVLVVDVVDVNVNVVVEVEVVVEIDVSGGVMVCWGVDDSSKESREFKSEISLFAVLNSEVTFDKRDSFDFISISSEQFISTRSPPRGG